MKLGDKIEFAKVNSLTTKFTLRSDLIFMFNLTEDNQKIINDTIISNIQIEVSNNTWKKLERWMVGIRNIRL